MTGARTALVLCPEAPYPITGGGSMRTASLLEYLASRSVLDVIVFREPGAPDPAGAFPPGLARSVFAISLPRHNQATATRAWRNLDRLARGVPPLVDRFAGFGQAVAGAIAGRAYDLALLEHFWTAPYVDALAARAARVVLDLHNIESAWHASLAQAERWPMSAVLRRFAGQSRRLERRWLARFSAVLVASNEDAARAAPLAGPAPVCVYPNAIPWAPAAPAPRGREPALIFSGNLEYRPNIHGLRFFLENVWPALAARYPRLVFRVAGKNGYAVARLLAGRERVSHVELGDHAMATLAQASIAVVPLFAGSGTRVKIVEAWAASLAVVSTPSGCEGLAAHDRENLLEASTAPEFIRAVRRLLDDDALRAAVAQAGRATYEREYTWQAAWRALDRAGIF